MQGKWGLYGILNSKVRGQNMIDIYQNLSSIQISFHRNLARATPMLSACIYIYIYTYIYIYRMFFVCSLYSLQIQFGHWGICNPNDLQLYFDVFWTSTFSQNLLICMYFVAFARWLPSLYLLVTKRWAKSWGYPHKIVITHWICKLM